MAMLSDQCRVRAYTDWPVHPVFVLCCAQFTRGESAAADVTTPPAYRARSNRHRALERTTCLIINMLSCSIKWLQSALSYTSCCSEEKELGKVYFYNFVGLLIYFRQLEELKLLSLSSDCSSLATVTGGGAGGLKLKLNC